MLGHTRLLFISTVTYNTEHQHMPRSSPVRILLPLALVSRPSACHAATHIHGISALIRFLSGSHATLVLSSIPRTSCCWRGDSPTLRTQYLGCWGASCSTTWAAYLQHPTTAADLSPRTHCDATIREPCAVSSGPPSYLCQAPKL